MYQYLVFFVSSYVPTLSGDMTWHNVEKMLQTIWSVLQACKYNIVDFGINLLTMMQIHVPLISTLMTFNCV